MYVQLLAFIVGAVAPSCACVENVKNPGKLDSLYFLLLLHVLVREGIKLIGFVYANNILLLNKLYVLKWE